MSAIPVAAPRTLTYARARLFLGTAAVGTVVVLSALALALELPARWLPTAPGAWPVDAMWIALAVALHAAVLAPFDLFAGLLVPREYGRTSEPLGRFLGRLWRGAAAHGAALTFAGTTIMLAARAGGSWGAMAAFLGLSAALLAWQPWVAAGVGGLRLRRATEGPLRDLGARTLVVDAHQPHVTGGAFGLPFGTAWLFPERWRMAPGRVALDLQVVRRREIQRSGARDRGVLLAVAWNAWPLLLALAVWGAPVAAADVVRIALVGTLGSFVGVLLLPTPSRWAVHRADLGAVAAGADPGHLTAALEELDLDGDGEPDRPEVVEAVFHPIPALRSRRAVLAGGGDPGPRVGPVWHAARVALYTSWAGMGFLGRAVHCNLGRPEVWVFLPSD
jgi:hypothetical protein